MDAGLIPSFYQYCLAISPITCLLSHIMSLLRLEYRRRRGGETATVAGRASYRGYVRRRTRAAAIIYGFRGTASGAHLGGTSGPAEM